MNTCAYNSHMPMPYTKSVKEIYSAPYYTHRTNNHASCSVKQRSVVSPNLQSPSDVEATRVDRGAATQQLPDVNKYSAIYNSVWFLTRPSMISHMLAIRLKLLFSEYTQTYCRQLTAGMLLLCPVRFVRCI